MAGRDDPLRPPRRYGSYEVVVVRRESDQWPESVKPEPGAEEVKTLAHGILRQIALALAYGFNSQERIEPKGYWAIVRRIPKPKKGEPQNGEGDGRPH